MPTKKIIIDPVKCIGCNTCPLIDPDTFELDSNTFKAKVIKQPQGDLSPQTQSAITSCPTQAISVVEE
ncbi:MAG: ferredoxin [Candidatus Shapirobacteria bacterium]|jgi:ferredoxin